MRANAASLSSRPRGPSLLRRSMRAKAHMSSAVDAIEPSAVSVSSQVAGASGAPG
jgi:hypothetical protein